MKLTKYIQSIIIRKYKKDKHLQSYIFLAFFRILLVFIPQIGYIHPDEFFQTIEIFIGDKFEVEHIRTWEFNNTMPIRSVAISYFLLKVPLNILELFSLYVKYYLDINLINSYMFLVFPRLIMCAISFLNDWSLYKICQAYSLRHEIRLLALSSSYIMLIYGTRTFSNTLEMAIASLLLYYAAECMIQSNTIIYKSEYLQERYQKASSTGEKVRFYKLRNSLPPHTYNRVILMATLCVIGIFNRPTFLIFGAPIVFYWLLRGMGTRSVTFTDFNFRILFFSICAVPSILIFTIIDSMYYNYLTMGEIHMLDIGINNFIFIPWNFIKYNIDPEKTASHGVHPKYMHLLVNMPLLFNVLGIAAIFAFGLLVYRFLRGQYRYLPRSQSILGLMSASIFTPLIIFSLINHQEPRFLLPITLPLILLHAPKLITGFCTSYPFLHENVFLRFIYEKFLSGKASSPYLLKIWYTINILLAIFYGFIHQGGVIQLAQHFSDVMKVKPLNTQIHLVTSHIYNLPVSFINIPSSNLLLTNRETKQKYRRTKEFFLYEYGSTDINVLVRKIKLLLDVNQMKAVNGKHKYQLYLAIPTSLDWEFNEAFLNLNNSVINYELVKVFYPHLSVEAMPSPFGKHLCDLHTNEDDLEGICTEFGIGHGNWLSISYLLKQFSSIIHQFGLALYRFDVKRRS